MTTATRPAIGQIWRISAPAPFLMRPVGSRLRVTRVTEAAVAYTYLEDGGAGVCDLARFQQFFALVAN